MTNNDFNELDKNKEAEEKNLNEAGSEEQKDNEEKAEIEPGKENPIDPSNVESGEVLGTNRTEEEYKKAKEAIEKEIAECQKLVEQTRDWKDIRLRLNDAKDKLKALFLEKEDDEKYLNQINELFRMLNDKQAEEQKKFSQESDENYVKLKELVDEAIETADKADNFREARAGLIKVQKNFRGVKLKRSQRDELLDDINKAFEALQQRQAEERENFEMECIENYHSLKKIIDEAVNFSKDTTQFGKARKQLIDAQSNIKGKKLKRDQRDELYQNIRDAFNDLNDRQEADRELFEKETSMNFDNLRKIVDEAIAFAEEATDFKQAREALINAQGTIKGMKLKRGQRDKLYADIRKVFNKINETQEAERKEFDAEANANYKRLTEKVDDAFDLVHGVDDFRLIRETLIAIQGEVKIVKLKRAQRNELFARIREAFGIFDKKKEDYFGKPEKEAKAEKESKEEESDSTPAEEVKSEEANEKDETSDETVETPDKEEETTEVESSDSEKEEETEEQPGSVSKEDEDKPASDPKEVFEESDESETSEETEKEDEPKDSKDDQDETDNESDEEKDKS